uniref:Uncharacterized protein isoform X2 n=1 Tax=Nicotiana tabacum TaxID=4097 RepID=A0A1S4DQH7_TOBAC|nr:PREDICTED: uncharacterized protein LOC107832359 isoform X2 [Nicotiana tabacum]
MAIMSCFELPVQQPNRDMSVQEFKVWIKQFDMDRDKRISREELTEALQNLHIWFSSWKARQVMKTADTDQVFSLMMLNATFCVITPRAWRSNRSQCALDIFFSFTPVRELHCLCSDTNCWEACQANRRVKYLKEKSNKLYKIRQDKIYVVRQFLPAPRPHKE